MGKQYKLRFTTAASSDGATSIKIAQKSRVRCIYWSVVGLAGAAITGHMQYELSKQNTSNLAVNDTPPTVLSSVGLAFPVSGAVNQVNHAIACDIDLDAGDSLYINAVFTGGAAPASINGQVYLYC